jgi:hypothetical protein
MHAADRNVGEGTHPGGGEGNKIMLPRQLGVLAFILTVLGAAGLISKTPAVTTAAAGDVRLLPMQFELLQEGPASACGDHCRTFISAVGAITKDTPGDFVIFSRDRDLNGGTLVLDSSGGSVLGTLDLGRKVRRLGIDTTVGRITKLAPVDGAAARASLSPKADCESMCAYLLLAGKQRFVPPEAQVLVHEIWLGDRREDAAAASYSAEDIVVVQRDIGRLAQYTVEMGGSIDLLETSLRIPPWEPMRRLLPTELRTMGLDTSVVLQNTGSVPMATKIGLQQPSPRRPPGERGWVIEEKAGQASLRRRHPLTVEGDEIGAFDIVLSCADNDHYDVSYIEHRRFGDRPAEPLKHVELAIGRRSMALKIVTSEIKETEIASFAKGTMPANMVEMLARAGSRSVTVTTATGNDGSTNIRVGNSGVPQNLSQLATRCAGQIAGRGGIHAELDPAKAAEAGMAVPK